MPRIAWKRQRRPERDLDEEEVRHLGVDPGDLFLEVGDALVGEGRLVHAFAQRRPAPDD
jgi:hypothetical protein